MSLVNDALKRARQAQQKHATPDTPVPPWHPADAAGAGRYHWLLWLAMGLMVAGVVCVWLALGQRGNPVSPPPERAHVSVLTRSHGPPLVGTSRGDVPAHARAGGTNRRRRANRTGVAPLPADRTAQRAVPTSFSVPGPNARPIPAGGTPAPAPPPRLQGILYDPAHPSAIVDGQTVFVGDTVRRARVTAITRTSVTLAGPQGTNVLRMER